MKIIAMTIVKSSLLIFALMLTACSSLSPDTPEPNYYILESSLSKQPKANTIAVGVELKIADYLEKPQMALRGEQNQIIYSDYHRWASSLKGLILANLREDLSVDLDSDQIFEYPWRLKDKVRYHLKVDILRLDGHLGDTAFLQARVKIMSTEQEALSRVQNYNLTQSVTGEQHNDLVIAERNLLKQLSQVIATSIQSMP
ncbi:membrane integrity-associated transporter subunit PqiC [Kangiella sp. TOML190]|uniref:PqiC family protein n=1 Tax=Kangiella sp. TOML190 TaxID=2931351 RepID=UPI0020410030|nr:PqiC family protein [Kangiella sp. TOML190]